ncbi:nitroreductase [Hyphomonas sp.]|uniref:nitroreductase family protein n=1 Tax=Hyphomonas sp. TaxID=87 RepID=UPI0039196A5B
MNKLFPPAPPAGTPLLASRPDYGVRQFLALRKSANKQFLGAPGPSPDALDELLSIAARVPDHRKLTPWRFIVFEGAARAQAGEAFAAILKARGREAEAADAAGLLTRAPVVVAVVSSPRETGRTPAWEQELSAGAVCYNLLLAANACGWGGVWLTEWIAYDPDVADALGLATDERIAGFIYLGTAMASPQERIRADMAPLVRRWAPPEP